MIVLSIVIVNWNVKDLLIKCLDSIDHALNGLRYEVIVVDNASADDSVEALKSRYPSVRLIVNRNNEGFARANNQGFKVAEGRYVLILNPDTLIKDGSIQKMMRILDVSSDIGMVGPRIVDENGVITPACKRRDITLWRLFLKRAYTEKMFGYLRKRIGFMRNSRDKYYLKSEPTACIQGACMLVRKADLDRVGYFDEEVPMYLDDNDLCYRFRKKGFKVFYAADAEIVHFCGASTKKVSNQGFFDVHGFQATDVFLGKHKGRAQVFINHIMLIAISVFLITADAFVLPVLFLQGRRKRAKDVLSKHIGMLVYSLSSHVLAKDFEDYKK